MSDLIYRLRYPAMSWTQDCGSQLDKEETLSDMAEAADEIERLTEHKRLQAEDIMSLGQQVGKLQRELAALRSPGANSITSNAPTLTSDVSDMTKEGKSKT